MGSIQPDEYAAADAWPGDQGQSGDRRRCAARNTRPCIRQPEPDSRYASSDAVCFEVLVLKLCISFAVSKSQKWMGGLWGPPIFFESDCVLVKRGGHGLPATLNL